MSFATIAPRRLGSSPWGQIQTVEHLADGIVRVHTAGHGGIWLSPERREYLAARAPWVANIFQNIPAYCEKPSWWEEDCEALIPMLVWFDEMPERYKKTPAADFAKMISNIYNVTVSA